MTRRKVKVKPTSFLEIGAYVMKKTRRATRPVIDFATAFRRGIVSENLNDEIVCGAAAMVREPVELTDKLGVEIRDSHVSHVASCITRCILAVAQQTA
jgi:hypothetical protein